MQEKGDILNMHASSGIYSLAIYLNKNRHALELDFLSIATTHMSPVMQITLVTLEYCYVVSSHEIVIRQKLYLYCVLSIFMLVILQ